ncbi:hypothetical protein BAUCODRAFT_119729 [Baudoinia panamericana UAMH 10762]|uniref:Formyl transferase C-terminal domain-containing protein n=1 Tax=Baudoinia panamericana (strain UAMH 10762) TaxID=717646 RepID=M2MTE6_BAUPA|nr:uncharacterized protein BAUCODRAFT_119729 [Baudoinia panamericana UAMH 10762]EMD00172.1 hypothetical protein BAUCODRAFT_119729 [Baudoinia panamericana UAMH 10762]
MKILFLCTAHNSLSQRLYLALSPAHDVTVEYALSDDVMISAVALARPDIIVCPFLTTLVPQQIYDNYLTLIVHPGPPRDAGPSAIDWVIMGDDGTTDDPTHLLKALDTGPCNPGRSHWGVTVLQAIEHFDAGPVWAFEQFPINIDDIGLTKSELYRGQVTQAAVKATMAAISRVHQAAVPDRVNARRPSLFDIGLKINTLVISPRLSARGEYERLSVSESLPFQGGRTHERPLLKAADREFDLSRHTARQVSRRIRCADSQPGVLSKVFGGSLYIYGGAIEEDITTLPQHPVTVGAATILAARNGAVCVATCDGKGVWINHTRRPRSKTDRALWPKVPATSGLVELGMLSAAAVQQLDSPLATNWCRNKTQTFQEVWIDFTISEHGDKIAQVHFDFYNGAMSTMQCIQLIEAMDYILAQTTAEEPIRAVILMGGTYFSNGIALNVIEAAGDSSAESWLNINRINDIIYYLLHEFPVRKILTFASIRGNAAAGGVALAAACDFVMAGSEVVLNPAYRAVGLSGSEFHTLSYTGRCGKPTATQILREMLPMSPLKARAIGLVDFVYPGTGKKLEEHIIAHVGMMASNPYLRGGFWKANVDLSPASLARARALELGEMCKDFWSQRASRYHSRRFDFVRKIKAQQTPLRFAKHRRMPGRHDEEELDSFDDVAHFEKVARQAMEDDNERVQSRKMSRHESVALVAPSDVVRVAFPAAGSPRVPKEMLFSCYYQPVEVPLTPPMSPMEERSSILG